ncbi:LapA family protein [Bosea sp. 2YAB26]|uniref:LapA family protein n=1 Tax=unclassified Bosea (in: a-proteobacteria) TaxID=2653178 RepID=UPI003F93D843
MKAFFKALILVPVALAIVLFSIANRGPVRVSLDPFSRDAPTLAFDLPLFAVVLAAIAAGVLIGGLASWIAQGKHRKAARRNRREAEALRSEAQSLRAAVPDSALPALTSRNN